MALYNVEVKEELSRVVEQEAESYEDAEELVATRYIEEEIVLDWEDLNSTTYQPYPPQKIKDSFNIQVDFDREGENVFISDESSSGTEYKCRNIEDLKIAFNDYLDKYIELENVKAEEKNMEV